MTLPRLSLSLLIVIEMRKIVCIYTYICKWKYLFHIFNRIIPVPVLYVRFCRRFVHSAIHHLVLIHFTHHKSNGPMIVLLNIDLGLYMHSLKSTFSAWFRILVKNPQILMKLFTWFLYYHLLQYTIDRCTVVKMFCQFPKQCDDNWHQTVRKTPESSRSLNLT